LRPDLATFATIQGAQKPAAKLTHGLACTKAERALHADRDALTLLRFVHKVRQPHMATQSPLLLPCCSLSNACEIVKLAAFWRGG
jgi:hypothetical protein